MEADNGRTKDSTFRAQETNAPHGCGLERHFSSLLWLRASSSDTFRAFCGSGAGSGGTFRTFCSSGAGSSGTFRAFCGSGASSSGIFRALCGCGAGSNSTSRAFCGCGPGLSNTFRAFCGSGAGLSGHFEPAAAPGQARAAISSHLRLRARLERPYAANNNISSQAGHERLEHLEREARSKLYE